MKDYKKNNIIHANSTITYNLSQLDEVKLGQKIVDADGETIELNDSKLVTKRRKDLRSATNVLLESSAITTAKRLKTAGKKNLSTPLTIDFVEFFSTVISKEISRFVCLITGSPRYEKVVSVFVESLISNTFINYLELPDEFLEVNDAFLKHEKKESKK